MKSDSRFVCQEKVKEFHLRLNGKKEITLKIFYQRMTLIKVENNCSFRMLKIDS